MTSNNQIKITVDIVLTAVAGIAIEMLVSIEILQTIDVNCWLILLIDINIDVNQENSGNDKDSSHLFEIVYKF